MIWRTWPPTSPSARIVPSASRAVMPETNTRIPSPVVAVVNVVKPSIGTAYGIAPGDASKATIKFSSGSIRGQELVRIERRYRLRRLQAAVLLQGCQRLVPLLRVGSAQRRTVHPGRWIHLLTGRLEVALVVRLLGVAARQLAMLLRE